MKVNRKAPGHISAERRHELVVSAWHTIGQISIGADELSTIQNAIADLVDEDQIPSPTTIARELAQEGAELRHPEVIECDAAWREARWEREAERFKGLDDLVSAAPLTLKRAEELLVELDRRRQEFASTNDDEGLARLKEFAVSVLQSSQALGKSSLDAAALAEQTEIAEW